MTAKSSEDVLREKVMALLARLPANTPEARAAIYEKVRPSIAERYPALGPTLEKVLTDIERQQSDADYDDFAVRSEPSGDTRTDPDAHAPATPAPEDEPYQAPSEVDAYPPSPAPEDDLAARHDRRLGKILPIAVAGAFVAAVVIVGAIWLLGRGETMVAGSSTAPAARTTTSASETAPAVPAAPRTGSAPSAAGASLAGYTSNFANPTAVLANDPKLRLVQTDGTSVFEITGNGSLGLVAPVRIDPAKTYRIRARIRVVKDDPEVGGARFYVGVATYDASGALQSEPRRAHRYAVMSAELITASQGWVETEGTISGIGDRNDQFREGTVFARPIVLANYSTQQAVSQVTDLVLEEVP